MASTGSAEPRCPACLGHGQAYTEEYDVHAKMMVTIHQDNGCLPCRGTGRVAACTACRGKDAACLRCYGTQLEPYYSDGERSIFLGDCRTILPLVQAKVDVLMTDPDYGVGIDFSQQRQNGQRGHRMSRRHRDAVALTEEQAIELALGALSLTGVPHGIVFWAGAWPRLQRFGSALEESGWTIRHLGVWYKPNGSGVSGHGLARRWEPWLWIARDGAKRKGEWNALPDCIDVSRVMAHMHEDEGHPTQKPLELIRRLLRFTSSHGDLILDPFLGSGTTLRAAKDLGRRGLGIELEEKYCAIAAQRLAQAVLPLAPRPAQAGQARMEGV